MKNWQHAVPKRRLALCLTIALAALAPISGIAQTDSVPRMSRAQAVDAVQVLTAWLECDECDPAKLKAVSRFGQSILPSLVATLNGGLSNATREMLRDGLGRRYDRLMAQAQSNPKMEMRSGKDEFIQRYQFSLDAQYRIRAAQALAAIGGAKSRQALEAAHDKAERAEVRMAIKQSLDKIR